MRPFRLHNPTTLQEAVDILVERDNATLYAGGTELLLVMKQGFLQPDELIDVKGIPELRRLEVTDGWVRIGAAVSHRQVETDPGVRRALPVLAQVESQIANVRVRTTGTIGGNLCFAEPHSDVAALGLLMDARARIAGPGGERVLGFGDLLRGPYETALERGEVLEVVEFPVPPERTRFGYERVKLRERPAAVAGVRLDLSDDGRHIENACVVVGCVGPVPTRVPAAEGVLAGSSLSDLDQVALEAARQAARTVEVIEDSSASEAYKRHLAGVLVKRACLKAAIPCLQEG